MLQLEPSRCSRPHQSHRLTPSRRCLWRPANLCADFVRAVIRQSPVETAYRASYHCRGGHSASLGPLDCSDESDPRAPIPSGPCLIVHGANKLERYGDKLTCICGLVDLIRCCSQAFAILCPHSYTSPTHTTPPEPPRHPLRHSSTSIGWKRGAASPVAANKTFTSPAHHPTARIRILSFRSAVVLRGRPATFLWMVSPLDASKIRRRA